MSPVETLTRCLDSDQPHVGVVVERAEESDGVRPSSHTCDHFVGKTTGGREELDARLVADDPLKAGHDLRIRVRADDRPDDVVGLVDVRDPVAQCLVDRVL